MSLIARVFRTFFADPCFQTKDQLLARPRFQSVSNCFWVSTTPTGRLSSVFALHSTLAVMLPQFVRRRLYNFLSSALNISSAMPAKILIVDDHEVVGQLLAQLVTENIAGADVQVCYSTSSALRLLTDASDAPFSLVVLDLLLDGESSGPITVSKLRSKHPTVPVLAMSALDGPDVVAAVFRYGASGFVPKKSDPEEFVAAVKTVLSGKVFVQDEMRDLSIVSDKATSTLLTAQQLRIVSMLGQGQTDKQIAAFEGIAEDTVAFHLRNVFRILGAATRAQAVATAYQKGLLRVQRPGGPGAPLP